MTIMYWRFPQGSWFTLLNRSLRYVISSRIIISPRTFDWLINCILSACRHTQPHSKWLKIYHLNSLKDRWISLHSGSLIPINKRSGEQTLKDQNWIHQLAFFICWASREAKFVLFDNITGMVYVRTLYVMYDVWSYSILYLQFPKSDIREYLKWPI